MPALCDSALDRFVELARDCNLACYIWQTSIAQGDTVDRHPLESAEGLRLALRLDRAWLPLARAVHYVA